MSERERRKCLEVLEVPYDASDDEIKKSYHRLAKQYHPDKNTEPGAKERFQEIGYAYKYLTEGPEAVGADDDEDGIPFEVFIRLFPWLSGVFSPFGSPFGNPFFQHFHHGAYPHHPGHHFRGHFFQESYFPGFYDSDEDDDSDYERYAFTRQSTYVPGPTKEEKKKEKKKRAKERRKAAKMGKQSQVASQAKSKSSQNASDTQQTSKKNEDKTDSKTSAPNNFSNVFETNNSASLDKNSNAHGSCAPAAEKVDTLSNGYLDKTKMSGAENVKNNVKESSHNSSGTSAGIPSQTTQGKKSKKKLKAEQKQREKEMELIAAEFKKKQKEQEEKEAQRRAVRQQKKERESTVGGQDVNSVADSVVTGNDSESLQTDVDADDEVAAVMEDVDDIDDDLDDDIEVDGIDSGKDGGKDKHFMTNDMSNMQASGRTGVSDSGQTRQQKPPGPVPLQRPSATPRTYHHDNKGSSRGGGANARKASTGRHRKKYKPQEFEEDPDENDSSYSDLIPQTEAEEMRMFHEALLRSEKEVVQQGVMPQSEAEERAMLHEALKQSQTANWHGNINTLDDVSDGDDSIFSGGSSGIESGRSSGTLWHSAVNQNSKRQDDGQTSSPQFGDSSSRPNLGGLGMRSGGFGRTTGGDRGASTGTATHIGEGSAGKLDQFDRTVGGKVKGMGRKVPEHGGKDDKAWEFGGSNSGIVFKSDNAEGIQFGFDDEGGSDVKGKHFQTFYNSDFKLERDEGRKEGSNINTAHAQTKTTHSQNASGGQMGPGQTANNRFPQAVPDVHKFEKPSTQSIASCSTTTPVRQDSLYKSSHMTTSTSASTSAATSTSMSSIISDMDDIDDVDTFEETSAASFSYPSQPASSFSLDIPSGMCNKERMKSYYSKKK
ncbi:uncharacterized protein [Haliotis asinina]|uniref:uncharacterized protein n=1 Tax=Haliotis asinina TaxID=109174 RepID=UPI0035322A1C